jgi:hypothetical protein
MQMREMKKYSIYLLTCVFLLLSSVAGFNWFINPYDIYETPSIEGVNRYKSEVERHTRLSKVYQLEKIKPDVVLLASSRGLVVPEEMFTDDDMTGFNLSLTSGSTYELYRMLQHAQQIKPLKRVVLALDELFTGDKQPGFVEKRLAVTYDGTTTPGRFSQRWRDRFSALLSHDAFKASLRTIRKQKESASSINKDYKADRVRNAGGHRQMFRTMEASAFSSAATYLDSSSCDEVAIDNSRVNESVGIYGQYFNEMVDTAYAEDIDLVVYISPIHARLLEVKCMTGEWQAIELTKRYIVRVVESLAEVHNRQPFAVWDFSGYNDITTEDLPVEGDLTTAMRWYWEGSHYSHELASMIFDTIYGRQKTNFGQRLDSENIEEHLEMTKRNRKAYLQSNKEDVSELTQLASRFRDGG